MSSPSLSPARLSNPSTEEPDRAVGTDLKATSIRSGARRRALRESSISVVVGLVVPVSFLIAWQLLADSGRISTLLFPSPTMIFDTILSLAESGILWDNAWVSIKRVMWGMLIGCGLGMAFGVLVGMIRSAETVLNPSFQMIRMVPHLALTSLFVLWFGIGETSKVLLIAKGVFFPVYIAMYLGFRNVDTKLVEVARVLQFSPLDLFRKILLPGSLSHLFIGLRLSLGVAWGTLVIAEMIAASSGLGYMMVDARSFSDTPVVFAGILAFAVLGIASDLLIRAAEKRALRWSSRYTG